MGTTDDAGIDQSERLEIIAKHIERHLKEREFCLVFEDDVERCWPSEKNEPAQQERQIQAFATSRGWYAFLFNTESGGVRVMFQECRATARF
jgi:hypothetical protein